MELKETIFYLTKEILKLFAENPVGTGQTFCNYGSDYNVVGFRTDKDARIQYQLSYIISKNGNVSSSVLLCYKGEKEEPEKKRIYYYKADDTRSALQKGLLSSIEKFILDNNTVFKAKMIETKHDPK